MSKSRKKTIFFEKLSFHALSFREYANICKDFKKVKFDFLRTNLIRTSRLVLFATAKIQANSYNLFSLF